MPSSELTEKVTRDILGILDGSPDIRRLENALRHLAKWRSALLDNTLTAKDGRTVRSGPFKGMLYDIRATEGAAPARRLGCYEATLAPILEEVITRAYPRILDIGCAEGYYAVGLARRCRNTKVMAHDTNPAARAACATLAKLNRVKSRITIGETVTHTDFQRCQTTKTFVLCDIEGAEATLLDPEKAPDLRFADILVEVHDCFTPGLSEVLEARFAATHTVRRIDRGVDMTALPAWMEQLSDLDRLIALWEWRSGPTPWLWMQSHDHP